MKKAAFLIFILFTYSNCFSQSSLSEIIDMSEIIPGLRTDVKYATEDNFAKQKLYTVGKAYGTLSMARSLKAISDSLAKDGLGIVVFDAYRPRIVQWLLWEITPDSTFVAYPGTGSRHNRGSAVDLTLYDLKTGNQLEMPTPFDEFSEKAGHAYNLLSEAAIRNRAALKNVMVKNGFTIYDAEWWHYNHIISKNFPLKDFQMR